MRSSTRLLVEWLRRSGQMLCTASNLKGCWKFDENTGTTAADSAGNGHSGTLTSGAAWTTGQTGSSVNLDGVNDYVQVGAQSSFVMSSAASFSSWIYPTGPGSDPTYGGIIVNREGEYEIARTPNGTIQWAFANTTPGWNWTNTGAVAPLNQWSHLAVTYDNGTIKTYLNGNLAHTYNGAGSIGDAIPSQNDFRIGGRQASAQYFQGRIDEVRIYNRALTGSEVSSLLSGGLSAPNINWLVADQLGTPRIVLDKTGSLATTKRHDYLPFGEELFAGMAGRTTALGYTADTVRQKFTLKERDSETALDFFGARYYSSTQGRFSTPDEPFADQFTANPQSWNLYSYVRNNPLRATDPDGRATQENRYAEFYERLRNLANGFGWRTDAEVTSLICKWRGWLYQKESEYGRLVRCENGKCSVLKIKELDAYGVLRAAAQLKKDEEEGKLEYRTEDQMNRMLDELPAVATPTSRESQRIADGHAWTKHQKEFPGWDKNKFTQTIDQTIKEAKGSNVKNLSKGRTAYWNDKDKMVVIRDPKSPDGGTAFRPTNGKAYFDKLK